MEPANASVDTIRHRYPNAISTGGAVERLFALLSRRVGLTPAQIMAADSICSDDLNTIEYPQRAYEMLGPFRLGGLNGFPFSGLTGMNAFAHHVPKDGAVFVFHAPHIGITKRGALGESLRPGQAQPSACCGAARAALAKLLRGEIVPGQLTDLDYQQNTIEQIFLAQAERIRGAAEPILEATEVMYEAIAERVDLLAARTEYPSRYLILMGGILINGDHDVGSFCATRRLVLIDEQLGYREDLLSEL
jgi:hypothetical protein